MKIHISRLDRKFSWYIRWVRDKGVCQRCLKQYTPPSNALHCSHFHGRRKQSVRFDPENCYAACYGCHLYFTANPEIHRGFVLRRLGEQRYNALMLRANRPKKPDYVLLGLWLDRELEKTEYKLPKK